MIWDHDDTWQALLDGEPIYVYTRDKPLRPIVVPYRPGMHPWEVGDQVSVLTINATECV